MNLTDLFTLDNLINIVVTFVIIYITQLVDSYLSRGRLKRIADEERELYHRKLALEKSKTDLKVLEERIRELEIIEKLQDEHEELIARLKEEGVDYNDDWSGDIETKVKQCAKQLEHIQKQAKELLWLKEQVQDVSSEVQKLEESINWNSLN